MGWLTWLIWSPQIRNAWDEHKTVKQNLQEMGLSLGTKGMLPIKNKKASTKLDSLCYNVFIQILSAYGNLMHLTDVSGYGK